MSTVTKKIQTKYFELILAGKKNFELRLNDFDIEEGDTLILAEHDENRNLTGRTIEKQVSYVGKVMIDELHWPKDEVLEKGLQIISLK